MKIRTVITNSPVYRFDAATEKELEKLSIRKTGNDSQYCTKDLNIYVYATKNSFTITFNGRVAEAKTKSCLDDIKHQMEKQYKTIEKIVNVLCAEQEEANVNE